MRRVTIEDITAPSVAHVAMAMRAQDAAEIFATRWDDDPRTLADEVVRLGTAGFVACLDGIPVAVVASMPTAPTVLSVGMFATDLWPKVALSTTRFTRNLIRDVLAEGAINRAECRSIAGHTAAHRWLERLGAVREAVLPDLGRNRETYFLYAWRRVDFET